MKSKMIMVIASLMIGLRIFAQTSPTELQKINRDLPHKFKEIRTGVTLEVMRDKGEVKIFMLVDDIEQYEEILVERSDEMQINYSQCKEIKVIKGKYKNDYVELVDHYPLSSKMSNLYRIKTITADGIMRMYPPVPIMKAEDVNAKN